MHARIISFLLILAILVTLSTNECSKCYNARKNENCKNDPYGIDSYTLHMSVHPHLDAFWIFDFESYYDPKPNQGSVHSYFSSNRFHSVKQIFNTASNVLEDSRKFREANGGSSQKAHRSFMNSEMGFFKRWYFEQDAGKKEIVKNLLKTKYWEILGGGFVEHDEGCAYYDDIIENFQMGLRFLKEEFNYQPKAAVSADSFGHSSTTLAILAHIGVEGFFVQRSDEHILLQNKTEFVWKAQSENGNYYGALPTHIRWAIHGFEDQFIQGTRTAEEACESKGHYVGNLQRENEFLKRILKSDHIMRYFGHDFQEFNENAYNVIEGMMDTFARSKCNRVTAEYGNPTEYFMTLMGEVFNKTKKVATRNEDIFPIWDYDSGLYWTGYYTTDPFHKKNYRDVGRLLHAVRKAFLPLYVNTPNTDFYKTQYKNLEQLAETLTYLQHHDGISGTSKYEVMDQYERIAEDQIKKLNQELIPQIFEKEFPDQINNPSTEIECNMENQCTLSQKVKGDVYLKIFNSAGVSTHNPIIVHIQNNQIYEPDCEYYEYNCLCTAFPCPCSIYLFPKLGTYSLIKLKEVSKRPKDANLMLQIYSESEDLKNEDKSVKANQTHFSLIVNGKEYSIGYKRLNGDPTQRSYAHLSRYGDQVSRGFTIRSGKYALGNNVKTEVNLSKIRKVYKLESDFLKKYVIIWAREQMKTVITVTNEKVNQFKVQTHSAAEVPKLEDLYLEISAPHIDNKKKFYTDSNGWLVMKRELFKHEDYEAHFSPEGFDDIDGNSYPMTAFCYIRDENTGKSKLSVNTDRPQGMVAYHPGTIWINFDRISADDGKWVYETTYRSEYQKYVHYITVQNDDFNERMVQKIYDSPLLIQPHAINTPLELQKMPNPDQKLDMQKWINGTGLNQVKFFVKPWNDSSVTLRVHNLHETSSVKVVLFSQNICPLLTAFYGNLVIFDSITEMSLGGNMDYEQFLKKKWNWNEVVDLKEENKIFEKTFEEKITLRPLEIRTFQLRGVQISQSCKSFDELVFNKKSQEFKMDLKKNMPKRNDTRNEKRIINYMLNEDHCPNDSPVLNVIKQDAIQEENLHSIDNPNPKKADQFTPSKAQTYKANNLKEQKPHAQKPEKHESGKQGKSGKLEKPQKHEEESDDVQNIEKSLIDKVKNLETLSKKEKQKYFKFKYEQIRSQLENDD